MPLEDFEAGSYGWSNSYTTVGNKNFSTFLGRFSAGDLTEKTYKVVDKSKSATFSVDVYQLDSWDGEEFRLLVNDKVIVAKSLYTSLAVGASSGSVDGISWKLVPLAGPSDMDFSTGKWFDDQKFRIEITILNPKDTVKIGFTSTLDQFVEDESFGVDNITYSNLEGSIPAPVPTYPASFYTIENPEKIGIGAWDIDGLGTAIDDVNQLNLGWYYNWSATPLYDPNKPENGSAAFVPMIWGKGQVTPDQLQAAAMSGSKYLLGFNEPDFATQANMSVAEALALWPKLMATGKVLGSPAVTTGQTLGPQSWLGQFMEGAEKLGLKVDFMAVHYYSDDPSIEKFKAFLTAVYEEYKRPVWVTEWALVDWENTDRFSREQIADFVAGASRMMDDLSFVDRHAWFGLYDGGDDWYINSGLVDPSGKLTPVGQAVDHLTTEPSGGGDGNPPSNNPWTDDVQDVTLVAATWQYFLGHVPSNEGFGYLIESAANTTDLNDTYFTQFNEANRYIAFAANLTTDTPNGMTRFEALYGNLSYEQAVELAFDKIISEQAVADADAAKGFFLDAEAYFQAVALERIVRDGVDLGDATKIAMIGSMLYEAMKSGVGTYAEAVGEFVAEISLTGVSDSYLKSVLDAA